MHLRNAHRCIFLSLFVVLFLFTSSKDIFADEKTTRKGKIKAATVFHLLKFVKWPQDTVERIVNNFNFCIFGNDPLNIHIEKTFFKKQIHSKEVEIFFTDVKKILSEKNQCHIIYFGNIPPADIRTIFNFYKDSPVLTIGGETSILDMDGIIQLVEYKNKLKIQIDNKSASQKGFKISSELLAIAEVID